MPAVATSDAGFTPKSSYPSAALAMVEAAGTAPACATSINRHYTIIIGPSGTGIAACVTSASRGSITPMGQSLFRCPIYNKRRDRAVSVFANTALPHLSSGRAYWRGHLLATNDYPHPNLNLDRCSRNTDKCGWSLRYNRVGHRERTLYSPPRGLRT